MIQTAMHTQNGHPQHELVQRISRKPQTIIVVYDQPKVVVLRRYTRTIIPHINPDEYEKNFNAALLDTTALIALVRRLNIEETMMTPPVAHQ